MELLSRGNRDQKGLRVWCVLQMFLSSGTPGIARRDKDLFGCPEGECWACSKK